MDSTAVACSRSSTDTRVWRPSRDSRSGAGGATSQAVRTAATRGWPRSGARARSTSARNSALVAASVGWPKMRSKASGRGGRSRSISARARPDSVPSRTRPLSKRPPWLISQSDVAEDSTDRTRMAQRCRWTKTPQDASTRGRLRRPERESRLRAGSASRGPAARRPASPARRRRRSSASLIGEAPWIMARANVEHRVAAARPPSGTAGRRRRCECPRGPPGSAPPSRPGPSRGCA